MTTASLWAFGLVFLCGSLAASALLAAWLVLGARRLRRMVKNLNVILGVEAMCAAQGVEFRTEDATDLSNAVEVHGAAVDVEHQLPGDAGHPFQLFARSIHPA